MRTPRRPGSLALVIVGLVAVVALGVLGLRSQKTKGAQKAPQLPSEHLAGPSQNLSGLLSAAHGGRSIVLFWASWCEPCKQEAADVERFAVSSEGRGRIVGVDWSDALSGAKGFISRYRWSFPTLRDADGTVGNEYKLTGLPTTFVLDGRGRIVETLRGPQTQATLHAALAAGEAR